MTGLRGFPLGRIAASCSVVACVLSCADSATGPAPIALALSGGDSVFVGRTSHVVAYFTNDSSVITAAPYLWASSDSAVGIPDGAGNVLGLSPGKVTITGTLEAHRNAVTLRVVPFWVDGGSRFKAAATGVGQDCAIGSAGDVACVAPGVRDSVSAFVQVPGSIDIQLVTLSASPAHLCGLNANGQMFCMGSNAHGEQATGRTSVEVTTRFAPVAGTMRFSSIGTGGASWGPTTCGINRTDSVVWCVGYNSDGQTGRKLDVIADTLAPVAGNFRALEVAVGRSQTCAISLDHRAYCWGGNAQGVNGIDGYDTTATPRLIPGGQSFAHISSGTSACGITIDGALYCWGSNIGGQLGTGRQDSDPHPVPVLVSLPSKATSVMAGNGFTCAITDVHELHCWGLVPGQSTRAAFLGTRRFSPMQFARGLQFMSVSTDEQRLCGITTSGRAVCL